jgi:hypothetical protein
MGPAHPGSRRASHAPGACRRPCPERLHLRDLPDVDRLHAAVAGGARRAVAIGAGYIGLELAEMLARRGLGVTLVERLLQMLRTPSGPADHWPVRRPEPPRSRGRTGTLSDRLEGVLQAGGYPGIFADLDGWIHRRLRALQLKHWKRGRTTFRELRARGSPEWPIVKGAGTLLRAARSAPAGRIDLNSLNRWMRTRMSGGVGGE